ncbi:hypothetical protein ACFY8F_34940 [Streptomyces tanashiensis]|uniref:hypothetical protein n=1 Tax=Streptomyces tanashiensis TaxID=67367 RepID=UPI00369A5E6C
MQEKTHRDEAEALTALEAGLGAAADASKAAERPRPDPVARHLLLRRRVGLSERRSSGVEPEYLRGGGSAPGSSTLWARPRPPRPRAVTGGAGLCPCARQPRRM